MSMVALAEIAFFEQMQAKVTVPFGMLLPKPS
jgi:hypothetical protein